MMPKVLIVTTRRWFSAARLAMAFADNGCTVDVVCPSRHPVMLTHALHRHHVFRGLSPLRSLHAGILSSEPDLIVPTDDLAAGHLHRLYQAAEQFHHPSAPRVRKLLERSLGASESYPLLSSRSSFLAVAREEGIQTPETTQVTSEKEVVDWLASNGLPAVFKADGTSGGEGVRIAHTADQALRAFRCLSAPLGTATVLKRTLFDQDTNHVVPWLLRHKPVVSVQPFFAGRDANIALACWKGEVLRSVSVDVVHTWRPKGPAVLVRLREGGDMLQASEKLVRRLKLSGLCGFDFMVDESTGKACLIEINARATQTCHLPHGWPRDMIGSLSSKIGARPAEQKVDQPVSELIALFPLAWQTSAATGFLASAYQDVPWGEPALVRKGFAGKRQSAYEKWMQLRSRFRPDETASAKGQL